MKILRSLLLLITLVSLVACNKDDEKETAADFSVLGITSVTINGQQFNIKNDAILETDGVLSVNATGIQTQGKHTQLEYAVFTDEGVMPSVVVNSSYSDVSIEIKKETNSSKTIHTVNISREGYQEQLSYVFEFYVIKSNKE